MTREEKSQVIETLTAQLSDNANIYLADISGLDAGNTTNLRRACFKAGVQLAVVKNTLLKKAMESSDKDFGELTGILKGNTSLMFSETGNAPAKVIKEFRKKSDKPLLKEPTSKSQFTLATINWIVWLNLNRKTNLLEKSSGCCNHLLKMLFRLLRVVVAQLQDLLRPYPKEKDKINIALINLYKHNYF